MQLFNLLKRHRRHESLRLPRFIHLTVQLIHLFERKSLRFINHRPHKANANKAETAPDEKDLCAEIGVAGARVDHVGGRVGDCPVEEPVGGGGHGE